MTEEENKIIKHLRAIAKEKTIIPLDNEIEIALNLIDRQNNELERLQEENKELKAVNAMQEYRITEMDIPKQVIRDKIEELEKQIEEAHKDNDIENRIIYWHVNEYLQELLGDN